MTDAPRPLVNPRPLPARIAANAIAIPLFVVALPFILLYHKVTKGYVP